MTRASIIIQNNESATWDALLALVKRRYPKSIINTLEKIITLPGFAGMDKSVQSNLTKAGLSGIKTKTHGKDIALSLLVKEEDVGVNTLGQIPNKKVSRPKNKKKKY